MTSSKIVLEVQNARKQFGGVNAVDGCSFEVEEGKITSLIGPNGAGKTTIFNIISGIIKPDIGRVILNGKDISSLPIHKIAQAGISRTFQQARLFKYLTIRDNLRIASDVGDGQMRDLLASFHFHKDILTLAGELSYGQQRIVELSRALLFPHSILMLDEPTAGLNQRARQELKAALRRLKAQRKTILLIEHDMDFVMDISDEIIVMAQGKVLAVGSPSQVRNNPKVLEVYLGK